MSLRTLLICATCVAALAHLQPAFAQTQVPLYPDDMFDKKAIDFGVVARGGAIKARVAVTNKFQGDVHIASVTTSCKCTTASAANPLIRSGETGYIDIVVDTVMPPFTKESSVIIVIDAPQPAEFRIPVKAFVRQDVVLTPGMVNFDGVAKNAGAERKVEIKYAGRQNWTIQKVENPNEHLDVKVTEVGREAGVVTYDLVVALKPNAPAGPFRAQVTLITDDVAAPKFPVLIEGRVETEFSITPELVAFGTLAAGQRQTQQLIVRGKRPFKVLKVESEKSTAFEIRKPADERMIHVIPLTLVAPVEATMIDEFFTVIISTQDEPLKVRVTGRSAGGTTGAVLKPALPATTPVAPLVPVVAP